MDLDLKIGDVIFVEENKKVKKGDKNGTKDELPIHIFCTSTCNKGWKVPKIHTKNVER